MLNSNELYYIIKIRINGQKFNLEQKLNTHDKAEAVSQAKEYKDNQEILSIKLLERLEGYEDRIIYEFERG